MHIKLEFVQDYNQVIQPGIEHIVNVILDNARMISIYPVKYYNRMKVW